MKSNKNAIEEISRLRLYQATLDSSKNWAYSSIVILVALFFAPQPPVDYELYKLALQLVISLILALSIAFVFLSGKQKTVLSRKQLKLLGISETNVILTNEEDTTTK